jgi:hypothetical protein
LPDGNVRISVLKTSSQSAFWGNLTLPERMWMGGAVPIGYVRENKKLVVDEEQVEKVRNIFEQYLELRSVPKLKEHLEKEGIKTRANKPFANSLVKTEPAKARVRRKFSTKKGASKKPL